MLQSTPQIPPPLYSRSTASTPLMTTRFPAGNDSATPLANHPDNDHYDDPLICLWGLRGKELHKDEYARIDGQDDEVDSKSLIKDIYIFGSILQHFLNFPQWLRVLHLAATSVTPGKISSGNDNSMHNEDTSRLILSRMMITMMESWLTRWIPILVQQILSGLSPSKDNSKQNSPLKHGRLLTQAKEEISAFSTEVLGMAQNLADRLRILRKNVLISAGFGIKESRGENIANLHVQWYATTHTKPDGSVYLCASSSPF